MGSIAQEEWFPAVLGPLVTRRLRWELYLPYFPVFSSLCSMVVVRRVVPIWLPLILAALSRTSPSTLRHIPAKTSLKSKNGTDYK